MSNLKLLSDKTTIANVTAGLSILLGLAFFIAIKHTEGVTFIVGAAIGFLLKATTTTQSTNH